MNILQPPAKTKHLISIASSATSCARIPIKWWLIGGNIRNPIPSWRLDLKNSLRRKPVDNQIRVSTLASKPITTALVVSTLCLAWVRWLLINIVIWTKCRCFTVIAKREKNEKRKRINERLRLIGCSWVAQRPLRGFT